MMMQQKKTQGFDVIVSEAELAERQRMRQFLSDNRLPESWARYRLEELGIRVSKSSLSMILTGKRKGPKVEEVLNALNHIFTENKLSTKKWSQRKIFDNTSEKTV